LSLSRRLPELSSDSSSQSDYLPPCVCRPAKQAVAPFPAVPASHQHLHHWVFLIDAQVNDYEEVRCEAGNICEGSITAHLQAKDMGLEDVPGTAHAVGEPTSMKGHINTANQSFTGMTLFVMTPHCHAPSCIRQEMVRRLNTELESSLSKQLCPA
jgi:hypothetical protein